MNSSPPEPARQIPQEVAASSDFLLTMVSDPPALEQILWGTERRHCRRSSAAAPTSICSTISPGLPTKLAAACTERDVRFLDAPVTGGRLGRQERRIDLHGRRRCDTVKAVSPSSV